MAPKAITAIKLWDKEIVPSCGQFKYYISLLFNVDGVTALPWLKRDSAIGHTSSLLSREIVPVLLGTVKI